jgi:hypothetical protein
MGRKPRVDRTPEEKWRIVQEGIKSGSVPETNVRKTLDTILILEIRAARPAPSSPDLSALGHPPRSKRCVNLLGNEGRTRM